jgi:hypothetical protein
LQDFWARTPRKVDVGCADGGGSTANTAGVTVVAELGAADGGGGVDVAGSARLLAWFRRHPTTTSAATRTNEMLRRGFTRRGRELSERSPYLSHQ